MILEQYINENIGDPLRAAGIGYIGGIVRPMKLNIGGKVKTVPGWKKYDRTGDDCKPEEVIPMVPNESQGAVLYFEHVSDQYGYKSSAGQLIKSTLRLIYWYDSRRYVEAVEADILRRLMDIVNRAEIGTINDQFKVLRVTPGEIIPSGANLFYQYTYDEAETQYLMPPFEVIAFNMHIDWILLKLPCNVRADFNRKPVC